MTRIVIAPDSFKGSISATAAAEAIAAGWTEVDPTAELMLRPMADGGEGTVAAFEAAVPGARRVSVRVQGPDGDAIDADWLMLPASDDAPYGTAVVDMASTSGIELLEELRPLDADSTGFGQAIADALDQRVSRLILGIGSSASTDGGTGMLRALGARFSDESGEEVPNGARGLHRIANIDLSMLRKAPETLVLTDVTNPLTGPRGAAAVFGPQKGLTDLRDQERADAGLARLAGLLGLDPATPGAGAAGGVGGALLAWGVRLLPGAGEVATLIGLADAIAGADAVVTGEGSYDGQSGDGKVPSYVAGLAAGAGVPAMLAAGRIAPDADTSLFTASVSLTALAGAPERAVAFPAHWLRGAGREMARSV